MSLDKRAILPVSLLLAIVLLVCGAVTIRIKTSLDKLEALTTTEHESFHALTSTNLGEVADAPRLFCVTTLRTPSVAETKRFCTDFANVHVYTDNTPGRIGTWATINWRRAQSDNYGLIETFTDFITVYVHTDKERLEYLETMDKWSQYLYAPRKAPLSSPLDPPSR